jgi:hypothetical protein
MRHVKLFNNINEYNVFANSGAFLLPNVSLVLNDGSGKQDVIFNHVKVQDDEVGSLCMYDKITNKFLFIRKNQIDANIYKLKNYTPIGIVVVPSSHNLYGDNSVGVMSLVNMNPNKPDSGGDSVGIPFGPNASVESMSNFQQIATISNNLNTQKISGYKGFGYVPSTNIYDYFTGELVGPAVGSGLDTLAKYPSIGAGNFSNSPYNEDGSKNSYYAVNGSSYYNGLTGNCLYDTNGSSNANKILKAATAQSDWKTASTIKTSSSSGYFPASCCCWRFNTDGVGQGKWYLPSCGEIGYLCARLLEIQDTILKVIEVYGSSVATSLNMSGSYWTSTFYNNVNARYFYAGIGGIGHSAKSSAYLARAFTKIKNN